MNPQDGVDDENLKKTLKNMFPFHSVDVGVFDIPTHLYKIADLSLYESLPNEGSCVLLFQKTINCKKKTNWIVLKYNVPF